MNRGLAFVFPGQGSQSVGMLSDLAENFSIVGDVFTIASEALGFDLWSLCLNGPGDQLNQTENTQPALLASGYAVWKVWEKQGGAKPALLAGHSLGEYTALVCAGVLEFSDAISLVADRGRFMQTVVPPDEGAMAAISGLDDGQVMDICSKAAQDEVVSVANFNFPGQVVIAGNIRAMKRAMALAKEAGAKRTTLLSVSVPSHCPLMAPAAEKLKHRMNEIDFSPADIPIVQNIDAQIRSDPEEIKQALISQLHQPVLWSRSIVSMNVQGIVKIIECGPGRVLSGLIRRIEKNIVCASVFDSASLNTALATC